MLTIFEISQIGVIFIKSIYCFVQRKHHSWKGCRQQQFYQHDAFNCISHFFRDRWIVSFQIGTINTSHNLCASFFKIDVAIYFQSSYNLPLFFPHANISNLVHQFIIMIWNETNVFPIKGLLLWVINIYDSCISF